MFKQRDSESTECQSLLVEIPVTDSTTSSPPMLRRTLSKQFFTVVLHLSPTRVRPHRRFRNLVLLILAALCLIMLWLAYSGTEVLWGTLTSRKAQRYENSLSPIYVEQSSPSDKQSPTVEKQPKTLGTEEIGSSKAVIPVNHLLHTTRDHLFGVVLDAGSTGSRVHVYELAYDLTHPNRPYRLLKELFEHIQPGLSAYAGKPKFAADSLSGLLAAAQKRIPNQLCSYTPLVLRATAGLRLLPGNQAEEILNAVRQFLSRSCFVLANDSVSILDGVDEGIYAWISLNFLANRLWLNAAESSNSSAPKASAMWMGSSVGALDLGGGSTQITFAPQSSVTIASAPPGFVRPLRLTTSAGGNEDSHQKVYTHSYLGLGLMSARHSMLLDTTHHLLNRTGRPKVADFLNETILYSACVPGNLSIDWAHSGHKWQVQSLDQRASLIPATHQQKARAALIDPFISASDSRLMACYGAALSALRQPVEGDSNAPVFPNSGSVVHRPVELDSHEFYAFSYFFDLAVEAQLINASTGGIVRVGDFMKATRLACADLTPIRPYACMDLSFITALLHDGYGFSWEKKLNLRKKLNSFEIGWSLGALFNLLFNKHSA